MRLLAVATSYPAGPESYAGRFVHELHAAMQELGVQVTTVVPERGDLTHGFRDEAGRVVVAPDSAEHARVLFGGSSYDDHQVRFLRRLNHGRALLACLRKELERHISEADAILVHWAWPLGLGLPTGVKAKPILGIAHGSDLRWLERSRFARVFAKHMFRRFTGVMTTRSSSLPLLHGLGVTNSCWQPMGADGARIAAIRATVRPREDGDLLGVGRLVQGKGFHHLVRLGAEAHRPVVLLGDGPELEPLKRLARQVGTQLEAPGWTHRDQVIEAMCEARVLVLPSDGDAPQSQEGFPLVVSEALLAGVPIAAFRVGGLSDVLPADHLAPAQDYEALKRLVTRLLSQPRVPTLKDCQVVHRITAAKSLLGLLADQSSRPDLSPKNMPPHPG